MPRKIGYDLENMKKIKIAEPIEQVVSGKNGIYELSAVPKKKMTVKEYYDLATSKRYRTPNHDGYDDLERIYWKSITKIPPIYATDIEASLTDADCPIWNMNNLGTILNQVEEDYNIQIGGLWTPYIYFGMWKASFSWHTEDMDLYSINYLHFGASKTWYAIPPSHGHDFEALANRLFPKNSRLCNVQLRHKVAMISPEVLRKNNIPFVQTTQEAREFIITYPFGYHAGYSHGFNSAEAVNYATERWIQYGKWANQCKCGR